MPPEETVAGDQEEAPSSWAACGDPEGTAAVEQTVVRPLAAVAAVRRPPSPPEDCSFRIFSSAPVARWVA